MDMEFKCGLMEQNTRDIGKITKLTEEENFIMLMEIFMMESGQMTWLMVMEFICKEMDQSMKANGKMINRMVSEQNHGQMVVCSKVLITMGRNKVLVVTNGVMEMNLQKTGKKMP